MKNSAHSPPITAIIPSSTSVEPRISVESWRRISAKYFSEPPE